MAMTESEETQVKGVVVILYMFGPLVDSGVLNQHNMWRSSMLRRCLPVRIVALHICRNADEDETAINAIPWGLLNFVLGIMRKEIRSRVRVHAGAPSL